MANVALDFGIGDTVYVFYPDDLTFTPQQRTVKNTDINEGIEGGTIHFTDGKSVVQTSAINRVFTTQALCAAAIVTDIIAKTAATVALDTTTSVASNVGQASTTLGRIG